MATAKLLTVKLSFDSVIINTYSVAGVGGSETRKQTFPTGLAIRGAHVPVSCSLLQRWPQGAIQEASCHFKAPPGALACPLGYQDIAVHHALSPAASPRRTLGLCSLSLSALTLPS